MMIIKQNKPRPYHSIGITVINDFNLIATTARRNERAVIHEILYLLRDELGDIESQASKTKIRGLIVAKTTLNPIDAVEKLHSILLERPYVFRYALRIVPIQKIVITDLSEIRKSVAEFATKIGENQSFRVTVEKRLTDLHSKDLIEAAVGEIKSRVDLKNPDWIIQVEVLGNLTGVSLLRPNDILGVLKEKML